MFKRKLAAIGLGLLTMMAVVALGEWVCGELLKSHGPLKRKTWLTQEKDGSANREAFGPGNVRFGLFPTPAISGEGQTLALVESKKSAYNANRTT